MIRAFCFDMDGVLFDTEKLGCGVMQEAASLQGIPLSHAQWRSLLGANMQTTREALNRWYPGQADPERFIDDWCRLMLCKLREDGMPFKPGAPDILSKLRRRGMKLALCTSNAREVVAEYLSLSGLTDAFDRIITGEMIREGKPAPDIYLMGAEKLGVAPAECVGVEDSVNGVRSVRASGMRSVMIPDMIPYTPDLAPYVDLHLNTLSDLDAAIFA